MSPRVSAVGVTLALAASSFAQSDRCRGALSALNRVKEEITPELSVQSPGGRNRLQTMLVTLETATNVCKDIPELWYYRMVVGQRLGLKDAYTQGKVQELGYQAQYDPFSVPPAAAREALLKVRKKWALVVGIDKFRDKKMTPLHYAVKDSSDFFAFLTDPDGGRFQASRVRHLTNEEATLQGIREGLGWLRKSDVQQDDLVLLYFASHGLEREVDPNGMSFIIAHDTNLDNQEKRYATSLEMIDLVQEINREIRARRVILILDTCYSGGASGARATPSVWTVSPPPAGAPASSAFSAAFQNLKIGVGRAVITSARADEVSFENETLMNGFFTHSLIKALTESHGAGTLGTIFPKIRDEVVSGVGAMGKTQTPTSDFSEQAAEIVISVPEGG
jgi:hypothetical protein